MWKENEQIYQNIQFLTFEIFNIGDKTYEVLKYRLKFLRNQYINNTGSCQSGTAITLRGVHFFVIEDEFYFNNTDSYDGLLKESPLNLAISSKYNITQMLNSNSGAVVILFV